MDIYLKSGDWLTIQDTLFCLAWAIFVLSRMIQEYLLALLRVKLVKEHGDNIDQIVFHFSTNKHQLNSFSRPSFPCLYKKFNVLEV